MAIGRISGPLLKANLVRDGVDLAFETDLLYLDVVNSRIGINNASPTTDLDVTGITRTTTLQVDDQLDVGNLSFTGNNITSSTNVINFQAAAGEATVYHSKLVVDDFELSGNSIATTVSNSPIEIRPNGTGNIQLQANTSITGNLEVTGDITAQGSITIGGNIIIGDMSTDTITINASIQSDLIPDVDNTWALGSPSFRWKDVHVNNFYTTTINIPNLNIGDLILSGNTITTATGQDVNISGNGTGGVRLGNLKIVNNIVTNISVNAITQFVSTGTGYFKIAGTNGFVPPKGTTAQQPAVREAGMTRYNTDTRALEVWDANASAWANPAGASGAVSETDANEISAIYALILG
jgi:hypothetical protein